MKHSDSTLEQAVDLRRTPRLSRGLALAIAAALALGIAAYGLFAIGRAEGDPGPPAPPVPGDHGR